MPAFRTEVPHPLGQEAATERLKSFLDEVRNRYKDQVSSLEGDWDSNVLSFALTTYGFKIDGQLTVNWLTARHRYRIVVQYFVRNVDAGGHGQSYRQ